MTATAFQALTSLAGKLTDPEDRERYTAMILYTQALPPDDEFRKLAEIMGLLTLLGQRVPDALAEAMKELRQLTDRAGEYYGEIDTRLEGLPGAITAGVDVGKMAKDMGEAFRQQIATSGLETSATALQNSSREIAALSTLISSTLKQAALEYQAVASNIADGVAKLTAAASSLQGQPAPAAARERSSAWLWHGLLLVVILCIGVVGGIVSDKAQTVDVLNKISGQIDHGSCR